MPYSSTTRRSLIRLVVVVAALAVPTTAFADCAHDIIDQAYKGQITKHYSQACYNAAIRIEPVDGSSYSDIDSIIRAAKRNDALRARDAAVVSHAGDEQEHTSHAPGAPAAHNRRSEAPAARTPRLSAVAVTTRATSAPAAAARVAVRRRIPER